jgi:phosphate transport system permease protein
MTPPPVQDGGLANAFFGSAVMCVLAILIGTPIGIAGRHLSRRIRQRAQGRHRGPLRQRHPAVGAVDRARPVRLHAVVMQTGGTSRLGRFAVAGLIVLPVVVRTTDEMLQLVPGRCAKPRSRSACRSGR